MMKSWNSPFNFLHTRARDAMGIAVSPEEVRARKMLASESFQSLIAAIHDGRDQAGHDGRLALSLAMLDRVALDPRDVDETLEMMQRGHVVLRFFGMSSPVTWFDVSVGSEDHQRLLRALERNIHGPLVRAARRVLRVRDWRRNMLALEREELIVKRMRSQIAWPEHPGRAAPKADLARYEQDRQQCQRQLDEKAQQLRELRQRRVAALASAACSGHGDWHSLCLDLTYSVLLPLLGAKTKTQANVPALESLALAA